MKGQWPLKLEDTLSPSSSVSLHPRHNNNFDLNTANTSRDKAMALNKIMLLIATTMALSITLMTVNRVGREEEQKPLFASEMHPLYGDTNLLLPSKRVSRFLAETKKPRAAANCKKDNDICAYLTESNMNSTCCNNQCMDLSEDKHNCGACKKKCKYTETCCRGGCVNTNFDKRHCGGCNKACAKGQYCVYGLCNYA